MAFWMNIHGCQSYPKVAIYVVKQLKNDSFRLGTVTGSIHSLKTWLFPASVSTYFQWVSFPLLQVCLVSMPWIMTTVLFGCQMINTVSIMFFLWIGKLELLLSLFFKTNGPMAMQKELGKSWFPSKLSTYCQNL